ncbi:hypothetical protein [Pleionea sp. CnH1-48]|uniref:hypothetical protein n=1 Tax=Pleionea sp. CnH1-48 TaxID=2954494 RepID=UPI002097F483|nr:hypothetical protein [Pleionea sp. CnH1-48]MCO7225062.1 hypothetical protein [Pleionea sp. CnH1-48]
MEQEETNPANLSDVVNKLEQLISITLDCKVVPKVNLDMALWNTQDVANYIGVTYKYTSEYIVTHHTFPNALRMPSKNQTKGRPRWYAGEVIKWVASHQEH